MSQSYTGTAAYDSTNQYGKLGSNGSLILNLCPPGAFEAGYNFFGTNSHTWTFGDYYTGNSNTQYTVNVGTTQASLNINNNIISTSNITLNTANSNFATARYRPNYLQYTINNSNIFNFQFSNQVPLVEFGDFRWMSTSGNPIIDDIDTQNIFTTTDPVDFTMNPVLMSNVIINGVLSMSNFNVSNLTVSNLNCPAFSNIIVQESNYVAGAISGLSNNYIGLSNQVVPLTLSTYQNIVTFSNYAQSNFVSYSNTFTSSNLSVNSLSNAGNTFIAGAMTVNGVITNTGLAFSSNTANFGSNTSAYSSNNIGNTSNVAYSTSNALQFYATGSQLASYSNFETSARLALSNSIQASTSNTVIYPQSIVFAQVAGPTGGTGDLTNVPSPTILINPSSDFMRHVIKSANPSVAGVFNWEKIKTLFFGETGQSNFLNFRCQTTASEQFIFNSNVNINNTLVASNAIVNSNLTIGNSYGNLYSRQNIGNVASAIQNINNTNAANSNAYAQTLTIKSGDMNGSYFGGTNPGTYGADVVINAGNINLVGNNGGAYITGIGGNIRFIPGYASVSSGGASGKTVESGRTYFYNTNTNNGSSDSNITICATFDNFGRFGVGTSNPSNTAEINGTLMVASNVSLSNTFSNLGNAYFASNVVVYSNLVFGSNYGIVSNRQVVGNILSASQFLANGGTAGGSNTFAQSLVVRPGDVTGNYWGNGPSNYGGDIVLNAGNVNQGYGNDGTAFVAGFGGNVRIMPGYARVSTSNSANNRNVQSGRIYFYNTNTNGISLDSNAVICGTFDNLGRFGVGTSNPVAESHFVSTNFTGGTGDFTNVANHTLTLEDSVAYPRIVLKSTDASVSAIFNSESNKTVYFGETTACNLYQFRGKVTTTNIIGVNNTNPQFTLDVTGTANVSGNISGPTITALSNTGIFSSNTAVYASNATTSSNISIYPKNLLFSQSPGTGGLTGSGDFTNSSNPTILVNPSTMYMRHIIKSADATIAGVQNWEGGKTLFYGEVGQSNNLTLRCQTVANEQVSFNSNAVFKNFVTANSNVYVASNITFNNATHEKKIVLWDDNPGTSNSYYGIGLRGSTTALQVSDNNGQFQFGCGVAGSAGSNFQSFGSINASGFFVPKALAVQWQSASGLMSASFNGSGLSYRISPCGSFVQFAGSAQLNSANVASGTTFLTFGTTGALSNTLPSTIRYIYPYTLSDWKTRQITAGNGGNVLIYKSAAGAGAASNVNSDYVMMDNMAYPL